VAAPEHERAARDDPTAAPPLPPPPAFPLAPAVGRRQLFALFFFAVLLFLLWELYRVFAPFLGPIVWAGILAMLFYPAYETLLGRVGGRATLAASILTLLVTTVIVLPTISISSVVTLEAISLSQQATEFVRSGRLNEVVQSLQSTRPGRLLQTLSVNRLELDYGRVVQTAATFASTQATAFARNVAVFVLNFAIMIFTLFFLFRDGRRMHQTLRDLIPMDAPDQDAIFDRLYETLSAVVRGMIGTATAQGILTWLALWALGVPYSAFLGVLAAFLSFIPLVGPAGVWVPSTIYLWAAGEPGRALALLLYGALVISMADNVLRPLLIGGQTQIPTFFLFFGILGGLQAFGFLGLFLGPVLLAIVVAFLKIYRERYGVAPAPGP